MSMPTDAAIVQIANDVKLLRMRRMGDVPAVSTVFQAKNTVESDTTTVRAVKAAPGTGMAIYVTELKISNRTPAEDAIVVVEDDTGTPLELFRGNVSTAAGNGGSKTIVFEPPFKCGSNKALNVHQTAALGDVFCLASGFVGPG